MDNSVVCWGINPPAAPADLQAKLIAAAFHGSAHRDEAATQTRHACAIQLDDTVRCWGDNVEGSTDVPPGLGKVKDLAVASYNSCALRPDGEPVCWGTRHYSPTPDRLHPMPPGLRLKGLRAELATYCGIKLDNSVACWGDEQHDHITLPESLRVFAR
jgi:Regulator of chromosome condensation (RCC1) repeat